MSKAKSEKQKKRILKTHADREWKSLCGMWQRFTEASKIIEMQKILDLYREIAVPPPKDLLLILACYLSGNVNVQPKFWMKKHARRS